MVFTLNVKICLAHTIDNRNFNWENLKVVKDIHRKNKIILCNFYLITFIENMFHSNGENVGPKNAIWLTAKRICAQHLKRNRVVCKTQVQRNPSYPRNPLGGGRGGVAAVAVGGGAREMTFAKGRSRDGSPPR